MNNNSKRITPLDTNCAPCGARNPLEVSGGNRRISQVIISIAVALMSAEQCIAIAPTVNTFTPIRRTSAQIMQGQVPAKLTAQPIPTSPTNPTPGIPSIGKQFLVADYQETGQYGPSGESSVGSTQLLVASKGRIRSFLKDGRIDNVLNLTHDSFFSPITDGGFTADPNVIFHPQWKKWIIFGGAFLHSSLVLAVSDSDPITPATVWSFYVVDTTKFGAAAGFTPSSFFDYTTLGADENALYFAANLLDFNNPSFFISATAYTIHKSTLNGTDPATIYSWRSLRNLGPNSLSPFTFQPALNFDAAPSAGFFPSIDLADATAGTSARFLVNTVTFNAQNVPTLSDPVQVPVLNYVVPFTVSALGTPSTHTISPVASFRLAPTHVRNNRLWLVTNIGVDNTGASNPPVATPPAGTISRDAARFTQIDITRLASSPATAVVSQGTLFQPTSANTSGERSFLTPAIMSNPEGKVIIAATACSARERLNAVVAQLTADNTAVGRPWFYTISSSDYNATEDWEFNPFARWGDHTRISTDPVAPNVFWTAQQWCSDTNTWGLQAAQVFAN